jgi:hypothetical protein
MPRRDRRSQPDCSLAPAPAHLSGGGALEGLLATISVDENVENVKGIVKRGGKWVRGRRHGHGILHSAEGGVYEGR